MAIRKIIQIDEERCNGCGLCVPNCAEGALVILNGKAKVVKESYCDGLGACLGHCPQDALQVIEREAVDFDEEEVKKNMEILKHINKSAEAAGREEHSHGGGCPGSKMRMLNTRTGSSAEAVTSGNGDVEIRIKPQLQNWPVQLNLVSPGAPYFKNADLLVAADCVPFAYPNFHLELLKGKVLVVGCPKLDDVDHYTEKLTEIIKRNDLNSITVAHMEVPCCTGIVRAVETALRESGRNVPVKRVKIGIDGQTQ